MPNLSQIKRERMMAFLQKIKDEHRDDDEMLIALGEIESELNAKKYGLVWEQHEEAVDVMMQDNIPVFTEVAEKEIIEAPGDGFNFILEGDNLHSLRLLEKTHKGKIDVIYIDPPYNTGNKDFRYRKTVRKCDQCGWFGLEEDGYDSCPFCGNSVLTSMLPMLRPWGFAPRNATSIETAQLNEEYTAIQQPLYSTLPDADDVEEIAGCANIRMAVRPNQRIIMLNKGTGSKGFTICCDCGAAMPGDDPVVLKDILRPYRSRFNKTKCRHVETDNVNLGYDFITDMLVLEFALDKNLIDINPQRNSWLNRAGQSLAEALRLAACQELDIEFTELVTGYRVRHNRNGDFVDIYLYDSLSSGAGYAVSIESSIQKLLEKTKELLSGCTCDSACHKCLKHYRNQYIHSVLDRNAALELLAWGEAGVRAPAIPVHKQQYLLKSLEQILQISGIRMDVQTTPILAEGSFCKKKVVVYPAMWNKPIAEDTIYVSDSNLRYAKPYAVKSIADNL